ncbi:MULTISPECIES: helix-turn-helix domain-containing protein [Synechocystis]|uniref:Helix-turn-helix domain-containing protein n=1 Tax=Synechocystis salina LEGE 00031 TaxID=1828736 RepID=A0ABR9VUR2_9SYNC|nr:MULTISPECIES: helix-turn-helix domain-containing protein [Synechocystis]MBD2655498.1 helix-turn-helix domain-containing protein [Synechocystis sp. FACHB-383]MBE9242830.1 helix-turn-helix domain-containing protein [Synechocystis salina LEGE 00041]MBE9255097.1 helix-turn-helix domain-containing protein [Synechocystis salina LEGE 00031]
MAISSPRLQLPTESEIELSQISSRILSAHLRGATQRLKVVEEDGSEETVEIPASALHLLVDILAEMAQGNAVTLIPIHAELTTQESADILNVSRPFLIKLLDSGEIPCRMVGKHRRIRFQDLMDYKQKTDEARTQALDALAHQAQDLGMGY